MSSAAGREARIARRPSPGGRGGDGRGVGGEVLLAVAWRTWLITWRRPVLLVFSLGQPLIWMLFFGFLFHRYQVVLPAGVTYLDFLAPGVSVMTVLFGASQAGIGWLRDLQTGFLPRLLNTPAGWAPILAGKVLADGARLLVQSAAVLALAVLLGARLSPRPGALLVGFLTVGVFGAAFSCLSCAVALRARAQEAMATYVHLVNMPLLFTSTALVPRREMPAWLAAAARWNPLTLTVDAWRGALLDGILPSWSAVLALLALAAALFLVALAQMRTAAGRYA
jgi:ABC-2 type transport system permease protein